MGLFRHLLSVTLIIAASVALAQDTPCPRNQPVIVFNSSENAIFLFGGYCSLEKTRLNDLWSFNGKAWKRLAPRHSPKPRSGHQMIYDELNNRIVLFGGKNNDNELLNDTWVFKQNQWRKLTISSPPPRQSHRLVYLDDGRILLFGGSNQESSLNDTWIFHNDEWKPFLTSNPAPEPRRQHTLSYDIAREKVIMFGGFDRSKETKLIHDDTWEWDDQYGWEKMSTNPLMARDHHAMVYDRKNKVTILFGGYNQTYLGDTWIWDGVRWNQLVMDGPSARAGKPGFIYDSLIDLPVLFGGGDSKNLTLMDFWQIYLIESTWKKVK